MRSRSSSPRAPAGGPAAPPGRTRAGVVPGGRPIVRLGRGVTDIMKEDRMTAPERPSPIPDSYRRVTPCLTVRGAAKALEFYAAVFDAAERMRFPGAGVRTLYAVVKI